MTPATVDLTDPPLLPGGGKRAVIHLQQHRAESAVVEISVVPLNGAWGDASPWVELNRSGRFALAPGTHTFTAQVNVPKATPNGEYRAGAMFTIHHFSSPQASGVTALTAVTAVILISVNDANQVKRIVVMEDPQFLPVSVESPLRFTVGMENTGNVDAKPHVRLEIRDRDQEKLLQVQWFNETVLTPGAATTARYTVEKHGLSPGQYWGSFAVYLDGVLVRQYQSRTFDVLERGVLVPVAVLQKIYIEGNRTQVQAAQPIIIGGHVRNLGELDFAAQLHVEVWRDGELVETMRSVPRTVPVEGELRLKIPYATGEPGRYEFVGVVAYGEKVTETKSVLLTVSKAPSKFAPPPVVSILLLSILAAAVVYWRVRG